MKTPDRFSGKEKRLALAVLAVALGAAFYAWVAEPMFAGASSGKSAFQSKKAVFNKSLKSLAEYDALKAEYDRMASGVPVLAGKQDITESLRILEKIAQECSVSMVSVKPQVFEEDDGSKRTLFDLSAHMEPGSLVRFLYELETSPYLLRVKRLNVSAGNQGSSSDLQCTLLISQLSAS